MANKEQIQVSLQFTADTKSARAELQSLQKNLSQISLNNSVGDKITKEMREASQAATELKVHLTNAVNVDTGNLDFNKLSKSLKASGTSLQEYGNKLKAMGPAGQQAFDQMANAMLKSNTTLKKNNVLLNNFFDQLKRTATWSVTSSILNGLANSISGAVGYAKALNKSLTDISIVTDLSASQMADFATQANKAAKALSTTTNEYAKASLIYFQQGLSGAEVTERTNATIKMANVTRQSAQEISDQMTAIWNNFDNGSKSLEYYADVITALGAATASSSDEIAQGLEKFAAVAETVGLSYEYATAALATVTSETRQSADVVGTAFKTMFSRMQGLKLGETLDDGTTLNKYSQGLLAVGINIKDSNGELKEMDTILDEMGNKWKTLNKDQQVALAQTVGGVRQYNQLIALMDNWDTFKVNLEVAEDSSGTLDKQHKKYEESWEAAANRVKASIESITTKLLDDKAFIAMIDGISKVVDAISAMIDGLGGVQGVLFTLGTAFTKIFHNQIASTLSKTGEQIKGMTKAGREAIISERTAQMEKFIGGPASNSEIDVLKNKQYKERISLIDEISRKSDQLSEAEKMVIQDYMDQLKVLQDIELEKQDIIDKTKEQFKEELDAQEQKFNKRGAEETGKDNFVGKGDPTKGEAADTIGTRFRREVDLSERLKSYNVNSKSFNNAANLEASLKGVDMSQQHSSIQSLYKEAKKTAEALDQAQKEYEELIKTGDKKGADKAAKKVAEATEKAKKAQTRFANRVDRSVKTKREGMAEASFDPKEIEEYEAAVRKGAQGNEELVESGEATKSKIEQIKEALKNARGEQLGWSNAIVSASNAVMALGSVINSVQGLIDVFNNPDMSGWEKFTALLTSVGSIVMSSMTAFTSVIQIIDIYKKKQAEKALAQQLENELTEENTKKNLENAASEDLVQKEKGETADAIDEKNTSEALDNADKNDIDLDIDKDKVDDVADKVDDVVDKADDVGDIADKADDIGDAVKGKGGKLKGIGGKLKGIGTKAKGGITKLFGGGGKAAAGGGKAAAGAGGATVAGAAIGIAVAAASIKLASDYYNKAAINAKKAQEVADACAESYNRMSQAHTDFTQTLSNYNEGVEGLKNLTKGTSEYTNALRKANEEAMNLIKNNPNLAGKYSVNADGLIEFEEGALEDAQRKKDQQLLTAQNASLLAQSKADQAKLEADQIDFQRKTLDSGNHLTKDDGSIIGGSVGAGAGVGLAIGTILGGPIGAAIGAGIGAIAGGLTGVIVGAVNNDAEQAEQDALDGLAQLYAEDNTIFADDDNLQKAIDKLGITDPELIASLKENREETAKLVEQMYQNNELTKAQNTQMAANALADNAYIQTQDERTKSRLNAATGEYLENYVEDEIQRLKDEGFGTEGLHKGHKTGGRAKEYWEEYAKAAGLENYELIDTTGTDKNRKFIAKDKEGNEITVSLDEMLYSLASSSATAGDALDKFAEKLLDTVTKLRDSTSKLDNAIADVLLDKSGANLTQEEAKALQDAIGGKNATDADIEEFLDKQFGDDNGKLDEETARAQGYESVEEMIRTFRISANVEFEEIPGLSDEVSNLLTSGANKKVADTYKAMGKEAGSAYVAAMETLYDGINWDSMTSDEQQAAMDRLASIDWSSYDAADQAADIVEDLGGSIDRQGESWVEATEKMRDAMGVVPDLVKLRKELTKISGISKDIDIGSVLSKKDYKLLIKYNKELEKYFAILSDGSAQFIGDKLDFQQDIKKTKQGELKEAIGRYNKESADLQKQYDEGLEIIGGKESNLGQYRNSQNYTETEKVITGYKEVAKYERDVTRKGGKKRVGTERVAIYEEQEKNYYDNKDVSTQLDFLESQGYDQEKIDKWRLDVNDGKSTVSVLEEIGKAVNETGNSFLSLSEKVKDYKQKQLGLQVNLALSAESFEELEKMLEAGEISIDAYNAAVMSLHEKEKWEGIEPKEVEKYAKSLKKTMGLNEEVAEDVALYTIKMNQGLDKLADGYVDWIDILTKSNKNSEEYVSAMASMKDAMSDVLGVSEEFLSDDFIIQNMEKIKLAAKGDADAINELAIAASRDILVHLDFENDEIKNEILSLHDQLMTELPDIRVGAKLDDEEFLLKAAQIVETAGMSVAEANAYFRSLGFEPKFEVTKVPMMQETKDLITETTVEEWGVGALIGHPKKIRQKTYEVPGKPVKTEMEVPSLTTGDGKPNFTLTRTNAGSMNNYSSSNSGGKSTPGGTSKPERIDFTKKRDIVDPFKEVTDAIEMLEHELDRASDAADRLWGADRIDALSQENALISKQIALLDQESEIALSEMGNSASILKGAGFSFNEDGTIANYNEIMSGYYDQLAAHEKAMAGMSTKEEQDDYRKKYVDPLNDEISIIQDEIDNYDSNKDKYYDYLKEREDLIRKQLEKRVEAIMYKMDLRLELSNTFSEEIDRAAELLGNSIYTAIEKAALMSGKMQWMERDYDAVADAKAELDDTYKDREKDSNYYENLQSIVDKARSNQDDLYSYMEYLRNLWAETFEQMQEVIETEMEAWEKWDNQIDHYENVLGILGLGQDKETKKAFRETKRNLNRDEYNTLVGVKTEYEKQLKEVEAVLADSTIDELTRQTYEENKKTLLEAISSTDQEMRAIIEEDLQSFMDDLQDDLDSTIKAFEKSVSGAYDSFEERSDAYDKMVSSSEDYLTNTNRLYETNKLINQANIDAEKTTNLVAKKKYQEYTNQIKALQSQGELSNYELQIAQERYELLKAQIALEEARNAKSQVKLTRDVAGNWGYMYTANQDEIKSLEQQVADAENKVYNTALEAYEDFTNDIIALEEKMVEELAELNSKRISGDITEEEYQKKTVKIIEYYTKERNKKLKLRTKSEEDLQETSLGKVTDSLNKFEINTQQKFEQETKQMLQDMTQNWSDWAKDVGQYAEDVGLDILQVGTDMETTEGKIDTSIYNINLDFESLKQKFNNVETASKTLKTSLVGENGTGGLVKELGTTTSAASLLNTSMKNNYDNAKLLAGQYQTLIDTILPELATELDELEKKKISDKNFNITCDNYNKALKDLQAFIDKSIPDKTYRIIGIEEDGNGNGNDDEVKLKEGEYRFTGIYDAHSRKIYAKNANGEEKIITVTDWFWLKHNLSSPKGSFIFTLDEANYFEKPKGDEQINDEFSVKLSPVKTITENKETGTTFYNADGESKVVKGGVLKLKEQGNLYIDGYKVYSDGKNSTVNFVKIKNPPDSDYPFISIGDLMSWIDPSVIKDSEKFHNPNFYSELGIKQYDKGGYTGHWYSSEGRIAMLHEQELVLNKNDTANMFKIIDLTRSIIDSIGDFNLNSLFNTPNVNYQNIDNLAMRDQTIQQEVHITAEFPNVQDHNEIEIALRNLDNTASQYVYRVENKI